MKKTFLHWFLLTCLCSLTSCNGRDYVLKTMDKAEHLLNETPDSALFILDSIKENAYEHSEDIRMKYELLRADARNKAYLDLHSDSMMLSVVRYYSKNGSANEKMKSIYLLGCTYRDMGDTPLMLKYFLEATEQADTSKADCDLYTLCSIYGQLADTYHKQLLPTEELKVLKAAECIALKDKDTMTAIIADGLRTRAYFLMGNDDSLFSVTYRTRKKLLEMGDSIKAAKKLYNIIDRLVEGDDITKAEMAIEEIEHYDSICNSDSQIALLNYYKGVVALRRNNVKLASECFYALSGSPHKEAFAKGLLKLYMKLGIGDSVAKYAQEYALANDSSHVREKLGVVERMGALYDYSRYESKARMATERLAKSEADKFYLYAVIIAMILTLTVSLGFYNKVKKTSIERTNILMYELSCVRKAYYEAKEERNKLDDEDKIKKKDEEISMLRDQLDRFKAEVDALRKGIIRESFFNTNIYKAFRNLSNFEKGALPATKHQWRDLYDTFISYYHQFATKTSHSGLLTEDQSKVCILIRIGFKESEIQNIMDIDRQRLNKIKIQINKKLFNIANASSLREHLKGLDNC